MKITCFRNKENINTLMVAFEETKIRYKEGKVG